MTPEFDITDALSDARLRENVDFLAGASLRYEHNACHLRELSREILRLRAACEEAREEEREACAAILDREASDDGNAPGLRAMCVEYAAALRSRGAKREGRE